MRTEPRLRPHPRFTHLVTKEETVLLVGDGEPLVLENALARDVVRLLDGSRTAVEIAGILGERHRPEAVHYFLLRLLDAGTAVETGEADGAGGGPNRGPEARDGLAAALREAWDREAGGRSIDVPTELWQGPGGIRLRLIDDYLRPELALPSKGDGPNGEGHRLVAGLGARRLWLGPILGSGSSCPACLQDRLRLNLTGRALVHRDGDDDPDGVRVVPLPVLLPPSIWDVLEAALPATSGEVEVLRHGLQVLPVPAGYPTEHHPVPRLPHCPVCGDPSRTIRGDKVEIRSRPRSGRSGGGYRVVDSVETLARYGHLMSPITGVVRRIRKVPVEGTELLHVYTASHAHHYGFGTVRSVKDDLRDHSGGKGRTDDDARASALCESLERFSSVHRGDEPHRLARRSELGDEALAPNDLMCFSPRQFTQREAWNRDQRGGFQRIPRPYHDEVIAWSPVRSLATGRMRLVPSGALYYGFRGEGRAFCDGDSNGLAAGNCLEEAILQGFLEVVERDAVALWWYNRAQRPGVSLASAGDIWIDGVVDFYDGLGREVWALDLTTDAGIPTFAALSALRQETEQDIIFGFGAHLDAGLALSRAFTELNQMLPTVLQSREERRIRLLPDFTEAVRWWDEATVASEPHLLPANALPPKHLPRDRASDLGDLRDDIGRCIEAATSVGCDLLVHDMTRPDVGFPVAKVVLPGMRHFWRRLGPGRLYDVPVALGWLPHRLAEEDLNPVSMFV